MKVGHILGSCNVASVSISLSVPAAIIDGYRWVNLGAYPSQTFTLVPSTTAMSTPWVDPVG